MSFLTLCIHDNNYIFSSWVFGIRSKNRKYERRGKKNKSRKFIRFYRANALSNDPLRQPNLLIKVTSWDLTSIQFRNPVKQKGWVTIITKYAVYHIVGFNSEKISFGGTPPFLFPPPGRHSARLTTPNYNPVRKDIIDAWNGNIKTLNTEKSTQTGQ